MLKKEIYVTFTTIVCCTVVIGYCFGSMNERIVEREQEVIIRNTVIQSITPMAGDSGRGFFIFLLEESPTQTESDVTYQALLLRVKHGVKIPLRAYVNIVYNDYGLIRVETVE